MCAVAASSVTPAASLMSSSSGTTFPLRFKKRKFQPQIGAISTILTVGKAPHHPQFHTIIGSITGSNMVRSRLFNGFALIALSRGVSRATLDLIGGNETTPIAAPNNRKEVLEAYLPLLLRGCHCTKYFHASPLGYKFRFMIATRAPPTLGSLEAINDYFEIGD